MRLSERVHTAAFAEPAHPDIALWRPATAADTDAVWALERSARDLDRPGRPAPRVHTERRCALPPERSLLGFGPDGDLRAAGFVEAGHLIETRCQLWLGGTVAPALRGRGLGTVLLRAQRAQAEAVLAGTEHDVPGWVRLGAQDSQPAQARIAAAAGFRAARRLALVGRDLADPVPEPEVPVGVRFRALTEDYWSATHRALNASFRDRWGFQPDDGVRWLAENAAGLFDAERSVIAEASDQPGRIVGLALADPTAGASGHISVLGVVRDHRDRGLGRALLTAALRAHRAAGAATVTLTVDADADPEISPDARFADLGFSPRSGSTSFLREY